MRRRRAAAIIVTLAPFAAEAGPCGDDVTQFEQKVRREGKKPSAGATAKQSTAAQLHQQPTPESVQQSIQRAQIAFDAILARARSADVAGDQAACRKALSEARDMFDPM